uniref:Immunoglobulin V-set domain-containing protein n=1 Tax=Cyclopterus lumpus TaxID=8103 RepID=A0A8C2XCF3_CYCLU
MTCVLCLLSQGEDDLLHHSALHTHLLCLWLVESKGSCSRWVSSSLSVSSTGSFLVEVTQTSYEAEENNNVTLGWRFSPRTDGSLNSINIFCEKLTHVRTFVLLHLFDGVEVPKSQDERFAGRVQWDKDALREGLVRLQVSRLRTDDSGVYLCDVLTGDGAASRRCNLNVTDQDPHITSPGQLQILLHIFSFLIKMHWTLLF